ncbi:hypothetical protein BDN72DRAFT_877977 [Pluteus cervinus]|uniref:Uncharacterized protein n=1 Tax=Pluteus cervinus TaxID=181527 RepID=A0ACD3AWM2_9AGAR|nr:hypothetical protein BDN72DRAFT_877977 [Pluteus cervinus]
MSTFPVELVENVLEHVYGEYQPLESPIALFKCSTVCRTWKSIAHKLIFSEITTKGLREIDIFKKDMHPFHRLVRRIWIKDISGGDVEQLLGLLPNLKEIHVRYNINTWNPKHEFPSKSSGQGVPLIFRNLTSLSLSGIVFPVKFFYYCTSLLDLKINSCKFDRQNDISPATPPQRPRSLVLRAISWFTMEVLEWMLSPQGAFDLTKLKVLRLSDRTDFSKGYDLVQAIVERCASSVQDLMIDPPTDYAFENLELTHECILHPSELSNLRTVTISIEQQILPPINFVPWMIAFFTSLPEDTQLEEILLPCNFFDDWIEDKSLDPASDIRQYGLEGLDSVWSGMPTLKRVVIGLYHAEAFPISGSAVSHLRKSFPNLSGRGMLEITGSTAIGNISVADWWWIVGS